MSKILVASGGHKHIMSPTQACKSIRQGLSQRYPGIRTTLLPMADGGDGTIDALVHAHNGDIVSVKAHDPLFRPREAIFGCYPYKNGVLTGVIEIAEAAGSALLAPYERQTMVATSYGVGELLLHARQRGCKRIIVGLGGSIVSDMGLGMAQALGISFFDVQGRQLSPFPGAGFNALSLDLVDTFSYPESLFSDTEIVVASDANIPLLGPHGQAKVFGPQKGATSCEIEYLDAGFRRLSHVIRKRLGRQVDIAYAGAAGGLGAGLLGFLGAEIRPGAALIAEYTELDRLINEHDMVVTGEGRHDLTTCLEKTPYYVAKRSQALSKPVLGIVGTSDKEASRDFYDLFISCSDKEVSSEEAVSLLEQTCSFIDLEKIYADK